jgi:GTP cyclohydrolase II
MLIDLGVRRIRLRTNDPMTARHIESFGIDVEID